MRSWSPHARDAVASPGVFVPPNASLPSSLIGPATTAAVPGGSTQRMRCVVIVGSASPALRPAVWVLLVFAVPATAEEPAATVTVKAPAITEAEVRSPTGFVSTIAPETHTQQAETVADALA